MRGILPVFLLLSPAAILAISVRDAGIEGEGGDEQKPLEEGMTSYN